MSAKQIELLSPAKNLECAVEAINHGADAVYIGAPMFGARAAAGNTLQDIEKAAAYAHLYRSRLYITLNTILADSELPAAQRLIEQLYEVGADALIIQDLGILGLSLPPIELHASTQMDNRTPNKFRLLEALGFEQAVLARELSLEKIREIALSAKKIKLEAFVHGALCVSYSGQCYMSAYGCSRSANRGECAQFCRLPYTLETANGEFRGLKQKHLLSLPDMNRSAYLGEMIEAGVSSFKIEGRLKDVDYVKNVTAYYRKALDKVLEGGQYSKTSVGVTRFFFEPDVSKSFNRNFTDYFLVNPKPRFSMGGQIVPWDTPKSIGEYIGNVKEVGSKYILLDSEKGIGCGDGLCFRGLNGQVEGFLVNGVVNGRVEPSNLEVLANIGKGCAIYRNSCVAFQKALNGKSAERKIEVALTLLLCQDGLCLKIKSLEEGIEAEAFAACDVQKANNIEKARGALVDNLSKLGNTNYRASKVYVETPFVPFVPLSVLNSLRRQAVAALEAQRNSAISLDRELHRKAVENNRNLICCDMRLALESIVHENINVLEVLKEEGKMLGGNMLSYLGNCHNALSRRIYKALGVENVADSFETSSSFGKAEKVVMRCKYCIRRELGLCSKTPTGENFSAKLFLRHQNRKYLLRFNCSRCEMEIVAL